MFSKNIIFKNFQNKKNIKEINKINNILKKELISSDLLLNSFKKNYKYISHVENKPMISIII